MKSRNCSMKLAFALVAALAFPKESLAVVFNVKETQDKLDFVACTPQTPNTCSLRSAIIWANQLPGVDTIQLGPGVYTLTLVGTEPTILSNSTIRNDLDITDSVVIRGAGTSSTIIDGSGKMRIFDIKDLEGTDQTVSIENMTLRNARLNSQEGVGAAIEAFVSELVGEAPDNDELIVNKVRMTGNALVGEGLAGAALYVDSANAWILNSEIDHNSHATVTGSAGAIMSFNDARSVVVQNTRIHNNEVGLDKSGWMIGFVGINHVWWDRNETSNNDGRDQIVLLAESDTLLVTNSTFSGNEGAAIASRGRLQILHSTIADNNQGVLSEGAVRNWGLGSVEIMNSIIAKQVAGKNCLSDLGPQKIASLGNNIDSDGSCSLILPSDHPWTDPKLGALLANGGFTRNHMPLAGSPAIDAAATLDEVQIDQRGFKRPIGNASDIGSVERNVFIPFP